MGWEPGITLLKRKRMKRVRMTLQLFVPHKMDIFSYSLLFKKKTKQKTTASHCLTGNTVYLWRVIDTERWRDRLCWEDKEKEKWQVLMSKDGWRWQRPVHSTPLFLSFLCPHFSSVTVNLETWIWWWYLVTTAMLNSLLWYFLPGWCVRLYADQPGEASTPLSSPLCRIFM